MDLVLDLFPLIYDFLIAGIAAKPPPYQWMFFPPIAFITTYLLFCVNAEPIAILLFSTSGYFLLIDVQQEPSEGSGSKDGGRSGTTRYNKSKTSGYVEL